MELKTPRLNLAFSWTEGAVENPTPMDYQREMGRLRRMQRAPSLSIQKRDAIARRIARFAAVLRLIANAREDADVRRSRHRH